MKIALIFDKVREDTMGIYFEKAFRRTEHTIGHYWLREAHKIAREYDLYIRIDDGDYKHPLPKHLRPSVFLVSDTHLRKPFKKIVRQAKEYDLVLCFMGIGTEELQRRRIDAVWVSVGCDPAIHRALDIDKRYEIGFVGTEGGIPRPFYLQELRERYPCSFIGAASYTQLSKIYSASKIGFSFVREKETFTMRCFEIMSCGALLLVNPPADSSLEKLGYIDKEHLVLYHSPSELFELIEYYLKNDGERRCIAEEGHRFTVENHTYQHRVEEMMGIIETRLDI